MPNFIPPLSGVLIGKLVKVLDLGAPTDNWRSLSTYFAGGRVLDATVEEALGVVAELLEAQDLVDTPLLVAKKAFHGLLVAQARRWDALVGQADRETLRSVSHLTVAPRGFARVIAADLALRVAAFRHAAKLPPLDPWDVKPGDFIKRATKAAEKTRDIVADSIPVDRTVFDDWCDSTLPEEGSIEKLARYLADEESVADTPAQLEHRRVLRRHAMRWRLRDVVDKAFANDPDGAAFVEGLFKGFVEVVNLLMRWFDASLVHASALPDFSDEKWRATHFFLALEGRYAFIHEEEPGSAARRIRRGVAKYVDDEHWRAVLVADELVYLETHATGLAGTLALVAPDGRLPATLNPLFWDPPVTGIMPFDGWTTDFGLADRMAAAETKRLAGDLEGALAERLQAVQEHPGNAMARFLVAAVLGELGRVDEAIGFARDAVKMDPGLLPAREELGCLLWQARKPNEARLVLEEAVEAAGGWDSASAELLYQLGVACLQVGDDEAADRALALALKRSPRDSQVLALASEAARLVGDARRSLSHRREASFRGVRIEPPPRRRRGRR